VKDILNGFTEEEKYKHQMYGVRKVMSNETTYQRLQYLAKTVGIPVKELSRNVAVVVKEKTENIIKMFNNQTYENKQLILETDFDETVKSEFDMIAFFKDEYEYGMFYLEDMVNGFKYTDSDYITKDAYLNGT